MRGGDEPGGQKVVLVDDLDERLDLAAAVDKLLTHAAGDLGGVALDTGDNGVGEGVGLGASVLRLDDDDLNGGKSEWIRDFQMCDNPAQLVSSSQQIPPLALALVESPCSRLLTSPCGLGDGFNGGFVPSYRRNLGDVSMIPIAKAARRENVRPRVTIATLPTFMNFILRVPVSGEVGG